LESLEEDKPCQTGGILGDWVPVDYTERSMLKYTQKVIELFKNPKNIGELENPTISVVEGDPPKAD
jgi:hypothetical protein